MSHEMLVGLQVTNDNQYQEYRRAMIPILESYGGSFGYDFKVSEVLISQTPEPINRVFTLRFPDEANKDKFFLDADYLEVKDKYFTGAVVATTLIATYPTEKSE